MSRTDAFVWVECDVAGCYERIEIQLCALAHSGSWDERYVDNELRRMDWKKDGDNDICDCHYDEE